MGAGALLHLFQTFSKPLADLAIADRITGKADGPGAPGSTEGHPGHSGPYRFEYSMCIVTGGMKTLDALACTASTFREKDAGRRSRPIASIPRAAGAATLETEPLPAHWSKQ